MTFEPYFLRNKKFFNTLIWKLKLILSENPNVDKFRFDGVKYLSEGYPQRQEVGILVNGIDTMSIEEFYKFYSINDINFLHEQLQRRLDLGM